MTTKDENLVSEWDQVTEETLTKNITVAELDELAQAYVKAWDEHDALKLKVGGLYREAEEAEKRLVTALELAGRTKYNAEGIGTFSFSQRMSVPTPKSNEQKIAFAKYLEEKGGKALFWSTFGVNSQTLNSFYKTAFEEHADAQNSEPFHVPGLEAPTAQKSLRLTKDRKKGSQNE